MSFGSGSGAGGQQVDPALQRFISEETEKQKMQVRNVTVCKLSVQCHKFDISRSIKYRYMITIVYIHGNALAPFEYISHSIFCRIALACLASHIDLPANANRFGDKNAR